MQFQTTIFGGLPVKVRGRVQSAEPDVGLSQSYFEVYDITFTSGYPISDRMWRRLQQLPDWTRIQEEGLEASAPDPDAQLAARRDN